jgi:hypothetical protein
VNSVYLVFFVKKRPVDNERSEGSEPVPLPHGETSKGVDKAVTKGPEVHEARVAIVQRVTL